MLGSLEHLFLQDCDLASIPTEHLADLSFYVTNSLAISNVRNCDLISILDNVKCRVICIASQSLGTKETQSLVRAMESNVMTVLLGDRGEVSLDITALTQYSGQGRCGRVLWTDTARRYREEVNTWAQRINWTLNNVIYDFFWIERT